MLKSNWYGAVLFIFCYVPEIRRENHGILYKIELKFMNMGKKHFPEQGNINQLQENGKFEK